MTSGRVLFVDDQSKNGVRVIVRRWKDGTTVEADCKCFGSYLRIHSNPMCPVAAHQDRLAAKEREGDL